MQALRAEDVCNSDLYKDKDIMPAHISSDSACFLLSTDHRAHVMVQPIYSEQRTHYTAWTVSENNIQTVCQPFLAVAGVKYCIST